MTNYNYNGMNAYDIANKVIANEEAYENADYNLAPNQYSLPSLMTAPYPFA